MSGAHYTAKEERLNVITHGIGIVLSLVALLLMMLTSSSYEQVVSSLVFGMSLVILYTASTLYHASKNQIQRSRLRVFDHAAIYILIAGTYTPVCLLALSESVGSLLLIIIWSLAIIGVGLKLFFTGKYGRLSTIMYICMGWVALFAIVPLVEAMSTPSLLWLLLGGIFYTGGAIIYRKQSLSLNHAYFHLCVLAGSACHFFMIYFYLL